MGYVFPYSDEYKLAQAISTRLMDYLKEGEPKYSLKGVDSLLLVLYQGTDPFTDPTVMGHPEIVLYDDESPGPNYARFDEILALDEPEDYGRNQERSRWRVVIECYGNRETAGVDPDSDQAKLASLIYLLTKHREGMKEWGFYVPKARYGAPDKTGKQYEFPVMVEFTIYTQRNPAVSGFVDLIF